jgi:hypothetical protein
MPRIRNQREACGLEIIGRKEYPIPGLAGLGGNSPGAGPADGSPEAGTDRQRIGYTNIGGGGSSIQPRVKAYLFKCCN